MNWVFISSSNCRSEICRLVFSIEAGQGIYGAVVSSEIAKGETFHFLIHKEQASWCREFPNYRSFRGHMQNRHKRRLPMFTPYIYQYTSVNFFALLKITWFGIFLFSFACFLINQIYAEFFPFIISDVSVFAFFSHLGFFFPLIETESTSPCFELGSNI